MLPQLTLPSYVIQYITDELNNGYTVIVHRDTITYNHWIGVGWIIENPTGGFGYLISSTVFGWPDDQPERSCRQIKGRQGQPA